MSLTTVIRATSVGLLLASVFAIAVPAPSRAATIFSSFGASDSYDTTEAYPVNGSSVAPIAPPHVSAGGLFTVLDAVSVTGADLALHYVAGTDAVLLSFWTDVGGLPGVQIGGVFSVTPPATPGVVTVTGITGVNLAAGQDYFIELTAGGADTISDWFANNQGLYGFIANTGSGWSNKVGNSPLPAFDVTSAVAIPEPVSAMLLVSGIAATALIRRRARRADRGPASIDLQAVRTLR